MTRDDLLERFYAALAMKLLTFKISAINMTKTQFVESMISFAKELIQDYHDTILNNKDILLELSAELASWLNHYKTDTGIEQEYIKGDDLAQFLQQTFRRIRP